MAEATERLTQWNDPVLGELTWDETEKFWTQTLAFNGREVTLSLDPTLQNPTREEQLAVIEPSRAILDKLREAEPQIRAEAVEEIAEAVMSQASPEDAARYQSEKQDFADSLELIALHLHGSGELYYRSLEFFPDQIITVLFNENLTFEESIIEDDDDMESE